MRLLYTLLLGGTVLTASAKGLEDIEKFLTAKCTVVTKTGDKIAVCDKGYPYFKVGLPVDIYRGSYTENPLTGKKVFVLIEETGKGKIVKSFKTNSIIALSEDKGVKPGDVTLYDYDKICFDGSDIYFQKLQNALPVVKGKNCRWTIKETSNGFEVLYNGSEVFFAEKELPSYAYAPSEKISIRELTIFVKPTELKTFKDVPVGVDAVKVRNADILAAGFSDKVELYQVVGNSVNPLSVLPTPVGQLVNLSLLKYKDSVYIIGNAFTSDAEPVSFVAKIIGGDAVIVQQNIPYLIGVLRKGNNPLIVLQEFNNGFGKVYLGKFTERGIEKGKKVDVPVGFRADTAVYSSDGELVFIDSGGTLRIFKGSFDKRFQHFMDVEGNFGNSYTAINIPNVVGDTSLRKLFFPPKPVEVQLFGFKGFLVAENKKKDIVPLIGNSLIKLNGGRLVFVAKTPKGIYETKTFRGYEFSDAIQGITIDERGNPFAVSGYKNPFLFQKGGSLYKLQFKYF
jgi:hypothetical protein